MDTDVKELWFSVFISLVAPCGINVNGLSLFYVTQNSQGRRGAKAKGICQKYLNVSEPTAVTWGRKASVGANDGHEEKPGRKSWEVRRFGP